MFLVVGLGNPGKEYAKTRHNIGFETIDYLVREHSIAQMRRLKNGLVAHYFLNGEKVILVKPLTYMNNSGQCVAPLADYFDIGEDQIIVIYDDIDLDPGILRIRKKGSAGSHNGMKSVIANLQTQNFKRIRVGIGKKPTEWDLANYVLSKFSKDEIPVMQEGISNAAKATELIITQSVEEAMNQYNNKVIEQ